MLDGLEDTPRIINGVFRLQVTPTIAFPSPLTLIPTYPDLPMEDVYPRVAHTDTRELYLRELGREPRRLRPVGHRSHVLGRAVRRSRPAAAELDRLGGERAAAGRGHGPGLVDVTVWRQRESMTVHLVNLTNPMMMKGPLREVIPIGPLQARDPAARGSPAREGAAADRRQSRHACETSGRRDDGHRAVRRRARSRSRSTT